LLRSRLTSCVRNSDDSHSGSATSRIKRLLRRSLLARRSNNRLLEGGDPCDNDEMSSEYSADDVPDVTETEYADASFDLEAANPIGSEELMADGCGENMDSNCSHSSPDDSASESASSPEEDEEDNEWKQVGWIGAKGVLSHAGYGMLAGATAGAATIGGKLLSGGGDPVDGDDAIAAHNLGESGGGWGGNAGGQAPAPTPAAVTVVPYVLLREFSLSPFRCIVSTDSFLALFS
jgi:hypothetical protein